MTDVKDLKNEELEKTSGGTRGPVEPEPPCVSDYNCETIGCEAFTYCYYYNRCNNPRKKKFGE